MSARAFHAFALTLLFLASGCYAATAGLVLGVIGATGSKGGTPDQPPAPPVIESVTRLDNDRLLVRYDLLDSDGGNLDVLLEWQPEDGSVEFRPASEDRRPVRDRGGELVQSHGTQQIPTEPGKRRLTIFVWNARADIGEPIARVRLRITAWEGATPSAEPEISEPFWAGNEPPEIRTLEARAASGVVPLAFQIRDSSFDPAALEISYRLGEEVEPRFWGKGQMTIIGTGPDSRLETSLRDGKLREHILFWDSVRDIGARANVEVNLELLPRDDIDTGPGVGKAITFTVDNNSNPVVEIVDLSISADRSFEIPIHFVVQDEESHPVSVMLQWAPEGLEFPTLGIDLANPSPPEIAFLKTLLAEAPTAPVEFAGQLRTVLEWRRELHFLSRAPVPVRGSTGDSIDLPEDRLRIPELVRNGLVFRSPHQDQARALPKELPFGEGSGVFVIGREIRLLRGVEGPRAFQKVVSFDPRDSIAVLSGPVESSFRAGAQFEVDASPEVFNLSSSPEGLLHTFVWDSLKDMEETENLLDSRVRIRAVGMDSEVSKIPTQTFLSLESRFLSVEQTLNTGLTPSSVALGDLDGDGSSDIAIASSAENTVSLYLSGSKDPLNPLELAPPLPQQVLSPGEDPVSVAIDDLNGDARLDVLVVNRGDDSAVVYLQEAAGFPSTPDWILLAGTRPRDAAIADVDSDGRKDVVVVNELRSQIGVYLANSSGMVGVPVLFTPPTLAANWTIKACPGAASVAVGDLNGDGRNDLVVASEESLESPVSVYLQKAGESRPEDPLFEAQPCEGIQSPFSGRKAVSVAIGDLDGDGRRDIAAAYKNDGRVTVYFQEDPAGAPGTLPFDKSLAQALVTGRQPNFVRTGDLNGDGLEDVIVLSERSSDLELFLQHKGGSPAGNGPFPFTPSQTLVTGIFPVSLAVGNLDNDGRQDLVVVNQGSNTASLCLQGGRASLPAKSVWNLKTGRSPSSAAIGDVNGDGLNDVVVVNKNANDDTLALYLQTASGILPTSASRTFTTAKKPSSVAIGDLDGDGRNDIAAVCQSDPPVLQVFFQDQAPVTREVGAMPSAVAIGDLSGDGRNDVVVTNLGGVRFFLQSHTGVLPDDGGLSLDTGGDPDSISVADVDGDGRSDLAVIARALEVVKVYLQKDGGFSIADEIPGAAIPNTVVTGDLDGEGRQEVLVSDQSYIWIDSRQPSGAWRQQKIPTFTDSAFSLAAGDLNGDGRPDIVTGLQRNAVLKVYFQVSGGRDLPPFHPELSQVLLLGNSRVNFIALGDVNGDGRNDIVAVTNADDTLRVFLAR